MSDRGETESDTHPAEDQPDGSVTLESEGDDVDTAAVADVVAAIETVVWTTAFLVIFGADIVDMLVPEATEDTAVDDAATGPESDAVTGAGFDPATAPTGPN